MNSDCDIDVHVAKYNHPLRWAMVATHNGILIGNAELLKCLKLDFFLHRSEF